MADVQPFNLAPGTAMATSDIFVVQSNSSGQVLAMPLSEVIPQAWKTYTPTWSGTTNPSIGNGVMTARYIQIGKTVIYNVSITMGTTTTFGTGEWSWTVPVAPNTTQKYVSGSVWAIDTAISYYAGIARLATASARVNLYSSASNGIGWANTTPFTWGNGDELAFTITYEAA